MSFHLSKINASSSNPATPPSNTLDKPEPLHISVPQIPQEDKAPLTNIVTVLESCGSAFDSWLEKVIKDNPHLNKFTLLRQLIVILNLEEEICNGSYEAVNCNIPCDLQLVKTSSTLLFYIQSHQNISRINEEIELAKARPAKRKFFLERLHEKCYPPYSSIIYPSLSRLLEVLELKDSKEIHILFRHDNFTTFLKCLLPLMKQFQYSLNPLILFQQKILSHFYESVSFPKLTDSMQEFIDDLLPPYAKPNLSACTNDYKKRVANLVLNQSHVLLAKKKRELLLWNGLELFLKREASIMEELAERRKKALEGYPEYLKLLHVAFRNAIHVWDHKFQQRCLYALDQETWEKTALPKYIKKTTLDDLNATQSLVSMCREKNKLYFIYIDNSQLKNDGSEIEQLNGLKNQPKIPPDLAEICESMSASLKLSKDFVESNLDRGFTKWLSANVCDDQLVFFDTVTPFLNEISGLLNLFGFFLPIFQSGLDVLINGWALHKNTQKELLDYVQKQKLHYQKPPIDTQPLSVSKKKKKQPASKAAPAVPAPEPKKKSRIQKTAETIKETVKVIKQLPTLTKKPAIDPSLAAQALQQQLSKKTANVTAPKVNRIRDLPGRAPSFKKLDRVTRWEEISVKFPDLNFWKEELKQCVYHIPHPLVDRYVHLGIEGVREGSACISIPAEITFGEEKPVQGTIGYTFSADGVCFHRHFTAKTSEPQKKEAAAYAQYPTLSSAYALPNQRWFIEEYQCQVIEDAVGNVTFKHTQTATCGEQTINIPVAIKIYNTKQKA